MSDDALFVAGLALGVVGFAVGVWMLTGPGYLARRAARLRRNADHGWIRL